MAALELATMLGHARDWEKQKAAGNRIRCKYLRALAKIEEKTSQLPQNLEDRVKRIMGIESELDAVQKQIFEARITAGLVTDGELQVLEDGEVKLEASLEIAQRYEHRLYLAKLAAKNAVASLLNPDGNPSEALCALSLYYDTFVHY